MYSHSNLSIFVKEYSIIHEINPNAKKSIGLDPSFGSNEFGIVAT
jgi:hypothetical protein